MCPTGGPDPDILDPARLVDVPAGTYEIGIDPDVPGGPVSRASAAGLPASYLATAAPRFAARLERVRVSRYLVTADDFERFVGATGFVTEAEREGWGWTWDGGWTKRDGLSWRRPFGGDADEAYMSARAAMPVLQVSWNDAAAWCSWLSRETGERVRLPLETEWEVFARITGVRSIVEIAPDGPRTVFDTAGDFFAALEGILNRGASSHPSGVLWEWTADWFGAYPGGGPDPDYGEVYRVLRGGSLASHPLQRGREYRFRRCPTARSPFYSFRFALA